MSENIEHPNRQLEYLHAQQASAWVQVLLDPTTDQRAAFVKWLKDSPRNVRDFLFMLTVEQALEHLDSHRLRDIEALIAQIDSRVVSLRVASPRAPAFPRTRRTTRWVAAAATAVVAVLAAWAFVAHGTYGWKEFATATGEQRAFEMEDGSVIHLNTGSRIALHFTGQTREVRLLRGEALFRVHHDAARPFRVYTPDALIQAVGTQFNVYNRPDGTEVAVIEGRVNITPERHPAIAQFNVPAAGGAAYAMAGRTAAATVTSFSVSGETNTVTMMLVRPTVEDAITLCPGCPSTTCGFWAPAGRTGTAVVLAMLPVARSVTVRVSLWGVPKMTLKARVPLSPPTPMVKV